MVNTRCFLMLSISKQKASSLSLTYCPLPFKIGNCLINCQLNSSIDSNTEINLACALYVCIILYTSKWKAYNMYFWGQYNIWYYWYNAITTVHYCFIGALISYFITLQFQQTQVDRFCERNNLGTEMSTKLERHVLVNNKSNTAFCFVPKVGCTNLKILFFVAHVALNQHLYFTVIV